MVRVVELWVSVKEELVADSEEVVPVNVELEGVWEAVRVSGTVVVRVADAELVGLVAEVVVVGRWGAAVVDF